MTKRQRNQFSLEIFDEKFKPLYMCSYDQIRTISCQLCFIWPLTMPWWLKDPVNTSSFLLELFTINVIARIFLTHLGTVNSTQSPVSISSPSQPCPWTLNHLSPTGALLSKSLTTNYARRQWARDVSSISPFVRAKGKLKAYGLKIIWP